MSRQSFLSDKAVRWQELRAVVFYRPRRRQSSVHNSGAALVTALTGVATVSRIQAMPFSLRRGSTYRNYFVGAILTL